MLTEDEGMAMLHRHRAPPLTPTRLASTLTGPAVFYERTSDATNKEEEMQARQKVSLHATGTGPAARK